MPAMPIMFPPTTIAKNDPDSGETNRAADNAGVNDVALELLQQYQENNKVHTVHRIDQKQNERAGKA